MENFFIPEGPYVFQSKKHEGESLEVLFFRDPGLILALKRMSVKLNCRVGEHLKFLNEAADCLETKMLCPICGKQPVKHFLIEASGKISAEKTCCRDDNCKKRLIGKNPGGLLRSLRVSSIYKLERVKTIRMALSLFKLAIEFPKKLNQEGIYELLKNAYLSKNNKPSIEIKRTPAKGVQLNLF